MNSQNKKVWIITRRAGYSFGSSLQAYAIQKFVDKLGFPNVIIDYDELQHNIRWRIRPFFHDQISYILLSVPSLAKRLFSDAFKWYKNRGIQKNKFHDYEENYLKLTPKRYKISSQIKKDTVDCDICICGSDQIWCPSLFDPVMYLDFAGGKTKKIAYAPSIGINTIEIHRDKIRNLVNNFNAVSVREREGALLLKELTGKDYPVVLDPTLMIDVNDWLKIESEVSVKGPYILCYFLGKTNIPYRFLSDLKEKSRLTVINIRLFYNQIDIDEAQNMDCVSPDEFLWLVRNATYVLTDSFHGVIFSVIYHRNFFVFERFKNSKEEGKDTRITNLLSSLGLVNRLILLPVVSDIKIDYEEVDRRLEILRESSVAYLKEALGNE